MGARASLLRQELAAGRPVGAATVDLVIAAGRWVTGRPPDLWSADDVAALGWYGVVSWCMCTGVEVPEDAGEVLRSLAEHLDDADGGARSVVVACLVGPGERSRVEAARPA